MEKHLFLLFIIYQIKKCTGIIYHLNETQYDRMPPVFHLDPYEACLRQPGALYCTVDAALVSDTTSPLLDMIQEYSAHKETHFNHSKITYGLCVTKTCSRMYGNTTSDLRSTLEGCLNNTINESYGLKTRVAADFYCNRKKTTTNLYSGDFIVAGVILTIALLNIVGSLYDFHCTSGKPGKGIKFLLCFSIRQNWRRLVQPITDHPDPRLKRLKGFNGIKMYIIMGVIIAHSFLPVAVMAGNTLNVEELYHRVPYHFIFNSMLFVQFFFILSAFLLVFNLLILSEKRALSWDLLPKAILLRWLRLTPPYALVLAVTSTWFRFSGSGPLWKVAVLSEVEDCRNDWWLNLLYLNNYKDTGLCLGHTWYIAADTQLFIVGIILCLALKTNRSRNIVLPIFFLIGIILPCLHTYFQDLDANLVASPENFRTIFMRDKTFNNVYKRGHTNLACYILGMALGYLVYHCQNTGLDLNKYRKYRYVYWTIPLIGMAVVLSGKFFYNDGPRRALVFRVAYAGLIKPLCGLLIIIAVAPIIFKYENVIRGLVEWNGWTAISRVSYSAYLLHLFFIRIFTGTQTTLYSIKIINLHLIFFGLVVMTFLSAYPFYLLVESPMAQLVKLVMDPGKILRGEAADTTEKRDAKPESSEVNGEKLEAHIDKIASNV